MSTRAEYGTPLNHPWRIAALVAVVANVTFNYLDGRIGTHTRTVADVSAKYPSLFTPAGYAFAIWGVIYASTLVYAVAALLPSQLHVRLHDRIAPWLVLTNALASLWIALFAAEYLGPSVLVIGAMLTSAGMMYSVVSEHLSSEQLSRWWRVPFGLWLGWLFVATLANISVALLAAGWSGWPLSAPMWTALLLLAAGLVALAVDILFLDPVVPFVVSWAAAAIAVEHWQDSTLIAVVAVMVAAKTLLLGTRVLVFNTSRAARAHSPRRVVLPRDWDQAFGNVAEIRR
jgi:translocator protein